MIDIDELERSFAENPYHASPEDELESLFDYLDLETDWPCLIEATHLLDRWERENTPLEMGRAQADFFFLKWNFVDPSAKPSTSN